MNLKLAGDLMYSDNADAGFDAVMELGALEPDAPELEITARGHGDTKEEAVNQVLRVLWMLRRVRGLEISIEAYEATPPARVDFQHLEEQVFCSCGAEGGE